MFNYRLGVVFYRWLLTECHDNTIKKYKHLPVLYVHSTNCDKCLSDEFFELSLFVQKEADIFT